MKKTYKIKATKRAWVEITADSSLSQQEVYNLAKEKASKGRLKWEEPSFNIIDINIDDSIDSDVKTKVAPMNAIDPLTNKTKES
jgi:hypothetical protein